MSVILTDNSPGHIKFKASLSIASGGIGDHTAKITNLYILVVVQCDKKNMILYLEQKLLLCFKLFCDLEKFVQSFLLPISYRIITNMFKITLELGIFKKESCHLICLGLVIFR